jgi:hypothetical protein
LHPKIYLIKANLTDKEAEQVRNALGTCPPVGTFVFSAEAAERAKQVAETSPPIGTDAPLAIMANFAVHPLAVIDEAGNIEVLVEGQTCESSS